MSKYSLWLDKLKVEYILINQSTHTDPVGRDFFIVIGFVNKCAL